MGKARIDPPGRAAPVSVADDMLKALKAARQFIVNGVEYGYIRMPDADCPDSAHDTLPMITAAIAKYEAALLGPVPVSEGQEVQVGLVDRIAKYVVMLQTCANRRGTCESCDDALDRISDLLEEAAVGSRLPGPPQQEIRDALARIVRLGMAPIDMDCLAPDEDAALRVLIRALVRAYPKEYEWDVQPPSIDFAEMEAQLRARIDPVPQAGGPVPGAREEEQMCATCGHPLSTHDAGPSEDGCRFRFGWGHECECGWPVGGSPVPGGAPQAEKGK